MNVLILKIGGDIAGKEEELCRLGTEIGDILGSRPCILVHGGGAEVSSLMKKVGLDPAFKDGIRMTSSEEMPYVEKVLSGLVNKRIVRVFQSCGVNAVGLSGSDGRIFTGQPIDTGSRTANVAEIDTSLLRLLMQKGYLPVVASTSMDGESYEGLNINADSVAFRLACALEAESLVFMSDVPGVLKDGRAVPSLAASTALEEIERGTITGGMIPKIRSSVEALQDGVRRILIGEYREKGDLQRLMNGRTGTQIFSEEGGSV